MTQSFTAAGRGTATAECLSGEMVVVIKVPSSESCGRRIFRPVRVKKEIRPSHPSVSLIRSVSGEPATFHLSFLPLIVCGASDAGTEGHHLANSLCPSLDASCPKG